MTMHPHLLRPYVRHRSAADRVTVPADDVTGDVSASADAIGAVDASSRTSPCMPINKHPSANMYAANKIIHLFFIIISKPHFLYLYPLGIFSKRILSSMYSIAPKSELKPKFFYVW